MKTCKLCTKDIENLDDLKVWRGDNFHFKCYEDTILILCVVARADKGGISQEDIHRIANENYDNKHEYIEETVKMAQNGQIKGSFPEDLTN